MGKDKPTVMFKHKSEFTVKPKGAAEVRITIETDGDNIEAIRHTFEKVLVAVKEVSEPDKKGWKFGLHRGQIGMSDNFDEELEDDFWFGEHTT